MLNWILQNGTTLLGFAGYILLGVFAFVGYFKKDTSALVEEADQVRQKLISSLKDTVDQQDRTLKKMQEDMEKHTEKRDLEVKDLRDKLHNLTGRNAVLEDLFKGRDPAMQSFLKDAPTLITIAHENNQLGKSTAESVKRMADALASLMQHIEGPTPAPQLTLQKE